MTPGVGSKPSPEPAPTLTLAEVENEIRRGEKQFLAFRAAGEIVRAVRTADERKAALEREVETLTAQAAEARESADREETRLLQAQQEAEHEHARLDRELGEHREAVAAAQSEAAGAVKTAQAEVQRRREIAEAEHQRQLDQEARVFHEAEDRHADALDVLREDVARLQAEKAQLTADLRNIADRALAR
jgi:hypothetical protein